MLFHSFSSPVTAPLPDRFPNPFRYVPHPLVEAAAREVDRYVRTRDDWSEELREGKMFGVLIVSRPDGETGFLAAFSGNLGGSNTDEYFVPPVYDLLQPDGFFRVEERFISDLNRQIDSLETSDELLTLREEADRARASALQVLADAKRDLREAKARRDRIRADSPCDEAELSLLVRESQYQKADYKRLERRLKEEVAAKESSLRALEERVASLKRERKARSAALQTRMFRQFKMLNALGEEKDLVEIFSQTPQGAPPAGAGECALPKLLQYAYLNGFRPLASGEFWWGGSPKGEVRRHGAFYPACQGKCAPILRHMLKGLGVSLPYRPLVPSLQPWQTPFGEVSAGELKVIYEDPWLLAVDKPAGMLSVPGKEEAPSVQSALAAMYPGSDPPLPVHRLDMDTSGILLCAKTREAYVGMQRLFALRQVKKRYLALLDGIVPDGEGELRLPLSPDYLDRPRQRVDRDGGKPAVTLYKVLSHRCGLTLVEFRPLTGRTHQIRVHAAHADGLNCPIVGDPLYGKAGNRLCLHACSLEFVHPLTGAPVTIKSDSFIKDHKL